MKVKKRLKFKRKIVRDYLVITTKKRKNNNWLKNFKLNIYIKVEGKSIIINNIVYKYKK